MKYDFKKRLFLAKKYEKFRNIACVQRAWRTKFKSSDAPNRSAILYNYNKLENTGSVNYIPRKETVISHKRENAKIIIEESVKEDASLSIRKLSVAAQISYGTTRSVLRDDLGLKPYRRQIVHELEPADYEKRVKFANWFLSLPSNAINFIIFSDEAWFTLKEPENQQNNRLWLKSKPIDAIELPLHDEKIMVWCAISVNRIFGPYFYEETINQNNYLDMLKKFFWPKLLRTNDYKNYRFQQDGAPPHTANKVQEWLTDRFSTKFINKFDWPPRSPDLNPCDYFLWGYLKARVYSPLPKSIDELKVNIKREIKNIDKNILKSTFLNFENRCNLIIKLNGGHIENN